MTTRALKPLSPGDVFWAPDTYHEDDPELVTGKARPWLVISNDRFPGQGEQYLCCGLTSNLAQNPDMIPIRREDWQLGGRGKAGQVDPQTVVTIKHAWGTAYTGRLTHGTVRAARRKIKSWLG